MNTSERVNRASRKASAVPSTNEASPSMMTRVRRPCGKSVERVYNRDSCATICLGIRSTLSGLTPAESPQQVDPRHRRCSKTTSSGSTSRASAQ
jgi:hypothetical protein